MKDLIISIIGLISSIITIYLFFIDKNIKKQVKYISGGIIFICGILVSIHFYEKYIISLIEENESEVSIDEENGFEAFVDEENGFQISYPSNWLIDQENSTDTEIIIDNSVALKDDGNPYRGMVILVLERDQVDESFLEGCEDCIINGKTFKTKSLMTYEMYAVLYNYVKNDKFYMFIFVTDSGVDRVESEPIFNNIINTLYIYDDLLYD